MAAVVLTALAFGLVLCYAAVSALAARHGYTEMSVRQEIEGLHAQVALLSYQVDVAKSDASAEQAAARLNMRPADAAMEVDYVLLPLPEPGQAVQPDGDSEMASPADLAGRLAGLAAEVTHIPGGRAEASMVEGHRR